MLGLFKTFPKDLYNGYKIVFRLTAITFHKLLRGVGVTVKNLEEFHSLENVKNPRGLIFLQEVGVDIQSRCVSQSWVSCLLLQNLAIQGDLIVTKRRISQKV